MNSVPSPEWLDEVYEELELTELRLMRSLWCLENGIVELRKSLKDIQIQLERCALTQKTLRPPEKSAYSKQE